MSTTALTTTTAENMPMKRMRSAVVRAFVARLFAPITFATRRRTARQLFKFALAEQESMLELRAAAARCTSPERRAQYLRHALDEERHATMFAAHAADIRRSLGLPSWGHPRSDCEILYDRLGEEGFLAFVHRGEHRGRVQFEAYAKHFAAKGGRARGGDSAVPARSNENDKLRALFVALIPDEIGHESYTGELLRELAGKKKASSLLRRMGMWEAFRAWRRLGQGFAQLVYTASMMLLYVTLLPFVLILRLARPDRKGWR